ncbi:MAG: hypothetical protein K2L42_03630 [Clostridia bacterium]|nr:hypothetical protein [Clostridia bacterium]
MKSLKIKLLSIAALAAALVISLATAFGLIVAKADRSVTISGSSVFLTSGNAEIWAHADGEGEDLDYYTMFVLKSDKDSVNFRKNLAFNWYYNDGEKPTEENKNPELIGKEGFLNAEIGFELGANNKVNFKKFVLTFESQQYTQTKDNKSTNYIVFYPSESGEKLNVLITDDKDAELTKNDATAIDPDHIKISLDKTDCNGGEYRVVINEGEATGKFVNVGGTYSRYSSSTTNPVTPLSFAAVFEEEDENNPEASGFARMAIYNLNGQSFVLENTREDEGHRTGGTVTDNTPPVLCLDKAVPFIGYEKEITFNYTVIDVITSSPSLETSYFMLTKEQADNADFDAEEYSKEGLFRVVTDSDDQKMIPHVGHYQPKAADYDTAVFDDNMQVKAAVKVLLKLTDTTSTGGMSDYVMLDWYSDAKNLVTVNGNKYFAVATDKIGATYAYTDGTQDADPANDADWQALLEEYQAKVDEAAKDLKAGSKNYFYLPSVENLIKDNSTRYEDLSFAVYYTNGNNSQESNKAYNSLAIPLNKAGKYRFTIFANDTAANDMYYYKDGEKKEFKTSDIWNMYGNEGDYEGLKAYLPWFDFEVKASEISIEEPKEQDTAYVGSTYTPDAFEINGVSYNSSYRLYRFENELYYNDKGTAMTYDEFMAKKDTLLKDESMRKYLTYIYASSELKEEDEEYEIYHEYEWNNSSPSFKPQHANAFYLIECKVVGTEGGAAEKTAYMGIASAPQVKALKGEDTWVQDNVASIVLLSIAGASLVGIVLLLVIKPKNKGDLDEIESAKPKKKSKKTID